MTSPLGPHNNYIIYNVFEKFKRMLNGIVIERNIYNRKMRQRPTTTAYFIRMESSVGREIGKNMKAALMFKNENLSSFTFK